MRQPINDADWQPLCLPRVHVDEPDASAILSNALAAYLQTNLSHTDLSSIVLVCIGTDRSTGDALGPLVGTIVKEFDITGLHVYGTLDDPVHATNLSSRMQVIAESHPNSAVIAVDACLGKAESIGYISLKEGPLKPGTGVNKQLPPVGDLHIVGVVNVGGFMEYLVLQNTRLSLVMRMAKVVARALLSAQTELFAEKRPSMPNQVAVPFTLLDNTF